MAKELQMAARAAGSTGRGTPLHDHLHSGGGAGGGKPVPGYLRPSAGSCHHVCKYGGTHTFEDKEAKKPHHPKPARRQPPPAPAPAPESQSRVMVKVRSVFRRRVVGDSSRAEKAAAGKAKGAGEGVEWKDIVAYDSTVVVPPLHGSSSPQPEKISAPVTVSGDGKKKDATSKGKKSRDKPKITGQIDGGLQTQDAKAMVKNAKIDIKNVKPPKGKKPKSLMVEKLPIDEQEDTLHGYQALSPSLLQSRASLLHDLEEEMMVHEADTNNNLKETKPANSLDDEEEECAAAAAETTSSRPIPAHRRAKSMSISSRSVRFPFARQPSKNSATFKLRSRSTRAPILPLEEEEKPARLRSRTRGDDPAGGTGRGIQLRIRSLRRRGVGGSGGGAGTGFVVPAVALRHQKTLEKKRSQRLYNNMIEETAGKLVKARKSRVKALVGAFESVISKIAK